MELEVLPTVFDITSIYSCVTYELCQPEAFKLLCCFGLIEDVCVDFSGPVSVTMANLRSFSLRFSLASLRKLPCRLAPDRMLPKFL